MRMIKKLTAFFAALAVMITLAGCSGSSDSFAGKWVYEQDGISAVYNLKDDGTGTYDMTVGDQTVTFEMKYEVQDNHFLVTFVNNEIFSENDVFDYEFERRDAKTLILKDGTVEELTFVKK